MTHLLFINIAVATTALAGVGLVPADGRPVAVVTFGASVIGTIAAADGVVISANDVLALATSEKPGFAARLYRAGATLVLAAPGASGCRPSPVRKGT